LSNLQKQLEAVKAAQLIIRRREAANRLLPFTKATFPDFEQARHHELIADALERVERGECRRLMITMPPRHTKSELASRRFPAWYMGRHPNEPIITASYGQDLSSDFGRDVRNIVNSEEYKRIFPEIELATDAAAAHKWKIEGYRGEYFAVGIGTATTGRGAKVLLIDDPHKNREEADSLSERERIWNWYRSTAFTRLMPNASIVVIMTRWHDDDLAGRLLKQSEDDPNIPPWEILNLPALAKEDDLLGRMPGEALWPEWYDVKALKEIEAVLQNREFQALYQQSPTVDHGDYFQTDWFKTYGRNELVDMPPMSEVRFYGCSDYATSERRGSDFTVHIIFAVDTEENIYVCDVWKKRSKPVEWIESCLDLMKKWKPVMWCEERGQILNSVGPFLAQRMKERGIYCFREQFTPSKDKTVRARAIQGRAQEGKVFFPKDRYWVADVQETLVKFPTFKHDDEVDCFSLLGLALEKLRGGVSPPLAREAWVPRNYTFDEIIHRSERRSRGKLVFNEAPIAGNHEPMELPPEEDYWALVDI